MKAMGPVPPGYAAGNGALAIGGRSVEALVGAGCGTPLFVYDSAIIARKVAVFREAFSGIALHYAVKANPFGPLIEALGGLVDGFDVASLGELERVARTALPVSFAGPGKRDAELEIAIARRVTINLESEGEAARALAIGERTGVTPRLAVRVNPPFALKGAGMRMGGLGTPFGVDAERAPALVRTVIASGAEWRGLHIYAGSQALHAVALIELQRETVALAGRIANEVGASPPTVNLGGGFGIPYFPGDRELDVAAVGAALGETLADPPQSLADTQFAIELGRWLVGEAGVYLTRVVDRKVSGGKIFVITDGGLHHMLAASGNFGQVLRRNYPLANASRFAADADDEATVVGCLCTPLDLLGDEVMMARAEVGDLIAIFCAGAYGLSASPQGFLSQPAARELLV
jgi:diaminopimelate decarboxylase